MKFSPSFFAVLVLHLLGTGLAFGLLPWEVPLVWTLQGDPDAFVPRPLVWVVALIPLVAYFILLLSPRLDSRAETAEFQRSVYVWGGRSFLGLFLFLYWTTLIYSIGVPPQILTLIKAAAGFLFLMVGNFFARTPYQAKVFWAIRTPWSEMDEDNWKRTHRVSGWLLTLLGLVTLLLIFMPRGPDVWVLLLAFLGFAGGSVAASYRFHLWNKGK